MKFSTSLMVASVAAWAQAQNACNPLTSAIPTCGIPCISSAASLINCALTDYACQCSSSHYTAIQSAAESCVLSSCQASAASVLLAANAICSCASSAGSAATFSPTTTTFSISTSTSSSVAAPSSTSSSYTAAVTTSRSTSTTTTTTQSLTVSGSGTLLQNMSTGLPLFTGG